jgi:putative ABC transport system ATP-binding protein
MTSAPASTPGTGRPSAASRGPIVELIDVRRHYRLGSHTVAALRGVSLAIERGSLVAIHGRSGSGKTTLLNLIGGLDHPTAGTVRIDGADLADKSEQRLVELRRHTIGFIFQGFGLIPILTAAENVQVPLRLTRMPVADRAERSDFLLGLVGLGDRAKHRPHELSGGEQQRIAIARALANRPDLLLADEPTGQLDSRTGRSIMALIHALVRSEGVTALVATHDRALIDLADRVIELGDGRIRADATSGVDQTAGHEPE